MTNVPFKGGEVDINEQDLAAISHAFAKIVPDLKSLVKFLEQEQQQREDERLLPVLFDTAALKGVLAAERKELKHVEQLMSQLDNTAPRLQREAEEIASLVPKLSEAVWSAWNSRSDEHPAEMESRMVKAHRENVQAAMRAHEQRIRTFIAEFAKAEKLFESLTKFWNEYGNRLDELEKKVGHTDKNDLFKQLLKHHMEHMDVLNSIGEALFRDFHGLHAVNLLSPRKQNTLWKRIKEKFAEPPEDL